MRTVQWSDVQKQPKEVAAAVDEAGEVCIERRGQNPLLLMTHERVEQTRGGLDVVGRLMHALALDQHGLELLYGAIDRALPWLHFLPEKDRSEFAREFVHTISACSDLGVWAPLGRMLHAWKQTAAIHADPALAKDLSRPLDADLGPVMMPTEGDAGAAEKG